MHRGIKASDWCPLTNMTVRNPAAPQIPALWTLILYHVVITVRIAIKSVVLTMTIDRCQPTESFEIRRKAEMPYQKTMKKKGIVRSCLTLSSKSVR